MAEAIRKVTKWDHVSPHHTGLLRAHGGPGPGCEMGVLFISS